MDQFREVFEEYYIPAHESLAKYCHAICGDEDDARDLVNEVAMKAFESFGNLKKKESFDYFLIAIARRVYLNNQRRKKFWRSWSDVDAERLAMDEIKVEKNLEIQDLYHALSRLKLNQREAIILSEIMGYKIREIAELQKVGVSAVKSNIRRGKIKLREILTEWNHEVKQFQP